MTTHKIGDRHFDGKSIYARRNSEYLVGRVWHDEMRVSEWEREGVQLEESEHGVRRCHGDV